MTVCAYDTTIPDFTNRGFELVLSERCKTCIESEGLTGLNIRQVSVVPDPEAEHLLISGLSAYLGECVSPICLEIPVMEMLPKRLFRRAGIRKCSVCGGFQGRFREELSSRKPDWYGFSLREWPGTDFFPVDLAGIVCTERVITALQKHAIKGWKGIPMRYKDENGQMSAAGELITSV